MGGRALQQYGVFTERKTTTEFQRIGNEIQNKIAIDFNNQIETAIIKCYFTKPDHGDLDLLLKINPNFKFDFKKYIQETFKPKAIYVNDGVYSFDYDNFQIDLNLVSENNWDTIQVYMAFDPIGNCMGKSYHKFGLSYGCDGLVYKFRNFNGRLTKNILISTNTRKIFEFGGYDYDRYLQGFETLEDIFKFVINSKYFNSNVFQFENLNHIDRKRNLRRGSYHAFLKYIEDNNIKTKYNFKNKIDYISDIDSYFPEANLIQKLNELKIIDTQNEIISQKFNGDLIMIWLPQLKGAELGKIINNFKQNLGSNFSKFILDNNNDFIYLTFIDFYNEFYKK